MRTVEHKCAEKTATAASGKMDQQCSRQDVVTAEAAAGVGAQGVVTPAGAAPHQRWKNSLLAIGTPPWCPHLGASAGSPLVHIGFIC